jgi:hypothetical protein
MHDDGEPVAMAAAARIVKPVRITRVRLAGILAATLTSATMAVAASPAQATTAPVPWLSFVAGTGVWSGPPVPGPATASPLRSPWGIATDASGNVYIADEANERIEKVTPSGVLSIIAGNGLRGAATPGPATASALAQPYGVAVDSAGNVYIADGFNYRVEKVTPDGQLSFFAGNGISGVPVAGPALSSPLNVHSLAVDSSDNVYIADVSDHVVEKVTPSGAMTRFAGNGTNLSPAQGVATAVSLPGPSGVAAGSGGNIYINDYTGSRVDKVDAAGTLSFFAGTASSGAAVQGPASASPLNFPFGVGTDPAGNVYIADRGNNRVEKVDSAGQLSFFAGTGAAGAATQGSPTASALNTPVAVVADGAGNVYIADVNNNRVEKVDLATTPPAPINLTAAPGNGSAALNFTPGPDGGAPITGYEVSTGGVYAPLATSPGPLGSLNATVSGLTNGTGYTVTVHAVNGLGAGDPSNDATVTPVTTASAPTGLTAVPGNTTAALSFTPPADDGGTAITGYDVSTGSGYSPMATSPGLSGTLIGTLTGLTNGTSYTVNVRASNLAGPGAPSDSAVVTPATTPAKPTGLTAGPGDASAIVSFTPGDDGGAAVTGYEVNTGSGYSPLATTPGFNGTLIGTVTGLTNGTSYTVTVRAINIAGPGAPSDSTTVTPATTPAKPTGLTAGAGDASAIVSFTPGDDGGLPIIGYAVNTGSGYSPLATTPGFNGTLIGTVTGLTNGTSYTITVQASNFAGPGVPSDSTTVTPATTPGQPAGLTATPGDTTAALSFTPGDDGGLPIIGYAVDTGSGYSPLATSPGPNGTLTGTVTGLTNGASYTVTVQASNFAGPGIPSDSATVTPASADPIVVKYLALGGPNSLLGNPTGAEIGQPGGRSQAYQRGTIYYSAATGAHEVHGGIATHYNALGGPAGLLGYPTTDESITPDLVGRFNHFTGSGGASIYWTPATGAWSIHGAIRTHWAALGWERGLAGYPTTDETITPDLVGRFNHFTGSGGASIYWTPATGAWSIHGAIRSSWAALRWERSRLGYPTTDEFATPGGRRNTLTGGTLTYTYATNTTAVTYR